jgi:hypothetical protein
MAGVPTPNELQPGTEVLSVVGRDPRKPNYWNALTINNDTQTAAMPAPRVQCMQVQRFRGLDDGART